MDGSPDGLWNYADQMDGRHMPALDLQGRSTAILITVPTDFFLLAVAELRRPFFAHSSGW